MRISTTESRTAPPPSPPPPAQESGGPYLLKGPTWVKYLQASRTCVVAGMRGCRLAGRQTRGHLSN